MNPPSVEVEQCCATVDDPWQLARIRVCNVSMCVCVHACSHTHAYTQLHTHAYTHMLT